MQGRKWIIPIFAGFLLLYLGACANPMGGGGSMMNSPAWKTTTLADSGADFLIPHSVVCVGSSLFVADTGHNEIREVAIATGAVTIFAGSLTVGHADGIGAAATFHGPNGIATDGTNLYVADSANNEIRKVVIATGAVTTLAGTTTAGHSDGTGGAASFSFPSGIACDGANLYVTDYHNHEIRKVVIATGAVTTLAGSLTHGYADGTGTAASFYYPDGIATDGTNLYVADSLNNEIRKVVIATGAVTTFAGTTTYGYTDGTGTVARFSGPEGIATDGTNLYVGDTINSEIREINIATAAVTTLAGSKSSGNTDGSGASASFSLPEGIATDGTNIYVADCYNYEIRKVAIATGAVTTLTTPPVMRKPNSIATDGTDLYVADTSSNEILKVSMATGAVTPFAGSTSAGSSDGIGVAARFNKPYGITSDGTNLYVADTFNGEIRKIVIATGDVTTIAGAVLSGHADGIGASASFYLPEGIVTDGTNLYVADTFNNEIRKVVIATGAVTTIAGMTTSGHADGTGTGASFSMPAGITMDGSTLYIADSHNHEIRKMVIATGVVTTIAGSTTYGYADGTGAAAGFFYPAGLATDGTVVYVADTDNSAIREVVIATGAVTTIAGAALNGGFADGTGTAARFELPGGIALIGAKLFVADTLNSSIRQLQY